jgi:hypothetical protein
MKKPTNANKLIARCVAYEQSTAPEHAKERIRDLRTAIEAAILAGICDGRQIKRAHNVVALYEARGRAA